jgi:hypothetical protein
MAEHIVPESNPANFRNKSDNIPTRTGLAGRSGAEIPLYRGIEY